MPIELQANRVNPSGAIGENQCFHCGEPSDSDAILYEDKVFCCVGCKTVFELITANDLDSFYELTATPGASLRGKKSSDYAWLEAEDVIDKLADYHDEHLLKISFHLPQIHCTSCVWLLENLYKLDKGVLKSQVNFLEQQVFISINPKELSLRALVEMLSRIGYAPRLQLDQLNKNEEKKAVDYSLIFQIGVAGFAFGNIMFMSFPEYFGLTTYEFQDWFGYLNMAFAIPVVFYSGRSYLQSAYQSLKQFKLNIDVPISLGIFTLLLRSFYEILSHTGAGYLDSLAGLVFFLLLGKWFQQRTYHHLSFERDYKSYFPISVSVKIGDELFASTLDKLKVGDRVLIQHGGLLPADGLIVEGEGQLDYSFVTGESKEVRKAVGEKVFAGGRQQGANLELVLTKNVSQSYLTQLWNNEAFKKEQHHSSSLLLERVGAYFTPIVLFIAFSTLIYWWPQDSVLALQAFTAVLIIACPCAISLSIPFTLGNAIRLLGKNDVYIKNTGVLEAIHEIDTIVFDKTGTLTTTKEENGIEYKGKTPLNKTLKSKIKTLTAHSTHPISRQMNQLWPDIEETEELDQFKEIPSKGIEAVVGNQLIRLGSSSFVGLEENKTGTWVQYKDQFYGSFELKNNFREGLESMFLSWENDYDFYLLSGDNDEAKTALSRFIPASNLYFEQSPHDKLSFIKDKQSNRGKLMMIGDGLNDAGALQQSEVGLVVTEDVNNFTPACDVILSSQQFAKLPEIITYIKNTIYLVYAALALAFIYNLIGLSFAVQGHLSPLVAAILMPLSSISIAILGTLGSSLLSKGLAK